MVDITGPEDKKRYRLSANFEAEYNLNKPTFHEYFYYYSYLIKSLVCLLVTENGARNPLKRICKINEKIVNRQGFKTRIKLIEKLRYFCFFGNVIVIKKCVW